MPSLRVTLCFPRRLPYSTGIPFVPSPPPQNKLKPLNPLKRKLFLDIVLFAGGSCSCARSSLRKPDPHLSERLRDRKRSSMVTPHALPGSRSLGFRRSCPSDPRSTFARGDNAHPYCERVRPPNARPFASAGRRTLRTPDAVASQVLLTGELRLSSAGSASLASLRSGGTANYRPFFSRA